MVGEAAAYEGRCGSQYYSDSLRAAVPTLAAPFPDSSEETVMVMSRTELSLSLSIYQFTALQERGSFGQ